MIISVTCHGSVCVCVQIIKKGQSFSKPDVSLMAVYITFTNKSIVYSS